MIDKEELKRKINVLKGSFELYAKKNLKIKPKDGDILPFIFNDPQKYIDEQLTEQLEKTGKIRAILLKGRQQGASTYTEGRFYWRTSLNKGKQAYILTHEQAATDNLFTMAKRYHDNSHPNLQPKTGAANAKELIFDKLDSGYKVGTAGSRAVGRSGTIQYFHGSEVAFWPNASEHFAGVMQAIPDSDGTEIILESTANGIGGKFHELWMLAVNGESEYIAIFVPWFWSKEYVKDAKNFKPTDQEKNYQKLYGVTLEQLAWRRAKQDEIGKDLCDQEYPYSWQEAFLSTGRTVFDKTILSLALLDCWKPKKRMILENKKFVERDKGELSVWFEPKPGDRYVIGADVAEGFDGGDYSCADVLDAKTGHQCAQWHGHIAPDLFGHLLIALGNWYNTSLIGVEANNHGLTTNIVLRDEYYPAVYVAKTLDDRGSNEKQTRRIGWLTTSKSKPYIIDCLSAELREGTAGIFCKETIQEMQSYIVLENGSYGAQANCFDDRVMSRAIAGEMLRSDYY